MWLLAPEMAPFGIAIGLVFGLFLVEIVALMLGGSLFGAGGEAPEMDAGLGPDPDAGLDASADIDAADVDAGDPGMAVGDAADLDVPEVDGPEAGQAGAAEVAGAGSGVLSWLGLGEVPFAIWLGGMLTAFGLTGYVLQLAGLSRGFGLLPAAPAAAAAIVPTLWVGRWAARGLGRLVPRTHSEAVSQRHLGGRTGLVTTGTARAGRPAQARVTDRYGNIRYLRVEPLKPGDELTEGTEIVVLWGRGPVYQAIRLDETTEPKRSAKES